MPKTKSKQTKEEKPLSKKEKLLVAIELINKELNAGVAEGSKREYVKLASRCTSPFFIRRPTGLASLDVALGGGLPAGGISQISGPENVGKNSLCNTILANNQRIHGEDSNIAWCWTEIPYDKPFGRLLGVAIPDSDEEIAMENELRKARGKKPLTPKQIKERTESIGNFIIIDKGSSSKKLEAVAQLTKTSVFQIVIVDSVAAILTDAAEEKTLSEEPQQSSEARLITRFQQKVWGAYSDYVSVNFTTIIAINQVRANRAAPGVKFAREWKVSGAHALRHGKLVDIVLSKGERIPKDTSKPAIGKVVRWELAKGKAGCHDGPKGEIPYYYDTGFDIAYDVFNTAKESGLLSQRNKKCILLNEDDQVIYNDLPPFEQLLLDNDWDLVDETYSLIMKKRGINCLHKW